MLGLSKGEVKLVSHNPEWSKLFKQEKHLLESLIGKDDVAIEHIGSTAIKGIRAKPIIDILIGVRQLSDVEQLDRRRMSESDYYMLKQQTMGGKIIFAKFSDLKNVTKTHYLHFCEYKGEWWNAHVKFRDRLNENFELAKQYEELKLKSAQQNPNDAFAYADAKGEFVNAVIQ